MPTVNSSSPSASARGLAHLAGDDRGQLGGPVLVELGHPAQDVRALGHGRPPPRRDSRARPGPGSRRSPRRWPSGTPSPPGRWPGSQPGTSSPLPLLAHGSGGHDQRAYRGQPAGPEAVMAPVGRPAAGDSFGRRLSGGIAGYMGRRRRHAARPHDRRAGRVAGGIRRPGRWLAPHAVAGEHGEAGSGTCEPSRKPAILGRSRRPSRGCSAAAAVSVTKPRRRPCLTSPPGTSSTSRRPTRNCRCAASASPATRALPPTSGASSATWTRWPPATWCRRRPWPRARPGRPRGGGNCAVRSSPTPGPVACPGRGGARCW